VMREKAEILAGLQPGGAAVLNADNRWFPDLRAMARDRGARVLSFGAQAASDASLTHLSLNQHGLLIEARLHDKPLRFTVPQSSMHWGLSSLCVLLILGELGVSTGVGVQALSTFSPLQGRGAVEVVRGPNGAFTLVDDSYNANPVSMRGAIASLAQRDVRDGRRIVVMSDMLELGASQEADHAALKGALDESGIDLVFMAGPLMAHLDDVLERSRRGGWAPTAAELAPQVTAAVRAGDVVMVKGSNGSRARDIAAALRALGVEPREG
jgi:UDP-N-acetylmuramoyl-tripeptide--D-alanyl-D-alanine ligase